MSKSFIQIPNNLKVGSTLELDIFNLTSFHRSRIFKLNFTSCLNVVPVEYNWNKLTLVKGSFNPDGTFVHVIMELPFRFSWKGSQRFQQDCLLVF